MAGRDGIVNCLVAIPQELRQIVETYQHDMKLPTLSYAFQTLLETHPDIDRRVRELYAGMVRHPTGEELSL